MNRRTTETRGWVKWPSGPEWKDSKEGGMSVVAVVGWNEEWTMCCIPPVNLFYGENLVDKDRDFHFEEEGKRCVEVHPLEDEWFPQMHSDEPNPTFSDKYQSVGLLAAVHLGNTGQSLWNEPEGHMFEATLNDLTPEGQALVATLEELYGQKVVLLTWLDT